MVCCWTLLRIRNKYSIVVNKGLFDDNGNTIMNTSVCNACRDISWSRSCSHANTEVSRVTRPNSWIHVLWTRDKIPRNLKWIFQRYTCCSWTPCPSFLFLPRYHFCFTLERSHWPGNYSFWHVFSWFSSVSPGKFWDIISKYTFTTDASLHIFLGLSFAVSWLTLQGYNLCS
jgi:hypothetical protein